MLCRSSWERICIFVNFTRSSNFGVLSKPFFLASFDIAINCGIIPANCFFTCGVTVGARFLTSLSNSVLVMTVLQSAAGVFAAGVLAAAAPVFAAAVLGGVEHTPITVITAASDGTAAEVSAGGAWAA